MSDNSEKIKPYSRKSIRLKGYDYSQPGGYFITICTKETRRLFGRIVAGEMILNRFGTAARGKLLKLQSTYPNVEIFSDEWVIMPDQIHTILWITDVGASQRLARNTTSGLIPQSLGSIISQYKSRVTKGINLLRRTPGEPVWQRNYYDRIIRNNKELLAIKKYITENPLEWEEDRGTGTFSFTIVLGRPAGSPLQFRCERGYPLDL